MISEARVRAPADFIRSGLNKMAITADKSPEKKYIMKINLKKIIAQKRFIVLAASMMLVVVIGAFLVYLFAIKRAPETKSSITVPEIKPSKAADKPRQPSANKKITVISPINVVDDAFKGYDLNKGPDAEGQAGDEQKTSQDNGAAKANPEEVVVPPLQAGKQIPAETKQETSKGKEAKSREQILDVSATPSAKPAGKADESNTKSQPQDEGIKLLNERMAEVGLSDSDKKKLIQSYLELRKVLPEKEAQKMIMWKIAHEKK